MTPEEQADLIERTVREVMTQDFMPTIRDNVSFAVEKQLWATIKHEYPTAVFNAIHEAKEEVIRQALAGFDISITRKEQP